MQKDEWISKPIAERIDWYLQQIDQLREALKNDGDSDADASNERLKTIKMRMAYDNTPSDERKVNKAEEYYETIYKAYKTLPNFDEENDEWPIALKEVKNILLVLNR